ncbi:unnamed protein product [Cylicostephanus goldi]|uniref:AMP-dependent synthetase/ligase domain-containing protein n=1 Tax=Cylicostephanus goldi TaxID=71465 RepID=A0A3P6QX89_CYLGO|nr:unnamed protein product [Cylicostephanus goldi]
MTECTMASHVPDLKNNIPFGSVGKVASNLRMKNHCSLIVSLQIIDPSSGKEMPAGMPGEICIKGPTVMLGYLGKPEATKSTIINGWLHTDRLFSLMNVPSPIRKQTTARTRSSRFLLVPAVTKRTYDRSFTENAAVNKNVFY